MVVASDYSSQMIELMKNRFEDSDLSESYTAVSHNKFHILSSEVAPKDDHSFDIENIRQEKGIQETDRFIFGCQADNESLPFKDNTFDSYLANLSLMWVDNHRNQLAEAFRVTKSGGRLAFSVLGREIYDNN